MAQGFRSVFMVASCAAAALGCYLVSLRVASERAALEQVETRIVLAQRDIRLLETEIGTRGRLAQLERWNVKVLALSAPGADQFLEGSFALARLARPERQPVLEAPVVLASAPAAPPETALEREAADKEKSTAAAQLMHQASIKLPARETTAARAVRVTSNASAAQEPAASAPEKPAESSLATVKPKQDGASPSPSKTRAQPIESATSTKKTGDNKELAAAAPMTKPARTANVDPLAPLPEGGGRPKPAKEPGPTR